MNFNYNFASVCLTTGFDSNSYGLNGLPITPNSISIIGKFKSDIEKVVHKNLIKYLDCYRNKDENITLIFEQNKISKIQSNLNCEQLIYDLLIGLNYIHYELDTFHGCICPESVVYLEETYKLHNWPFSKITDYGKLLNSQAFLPFNLKFVSPERLLDLYQIPSKKSDVWSLSLTILFLIDSTIRLPKNPADFLLCKSSKEVLKLLSPKNIPEKLNKFFNCSLEPLIQNRYTSKSLLNLLKNSLSNQDHFSQNNTSEIIKLNIKEIYYFWKLSNGKKSHLEYEKSQPSICLLPKLVKLNSKLDKKNENYKVFILPNKIKIIDLKPLEEKLNNLPKKIFYPLLFSQSILEKDVSLINEKNKNIETNFDDSTLCLPLIIKENDFNYQCKRVILFKRLVNEYPFTSKKLSEETKFDIPPFFRAKVWSILLKVSSCDIFVYNMISKTTNLNTDRQISVDIPRCHQYNELLSSPDGHIKLKKVLKAWLKFNEHIYVYWQGLDSLAAPFILLNFHDEPLAFASFNAFIKKYLEGFFCKDNTYTIQEYLALFSHLIAYHDPQLFNHLQQLGFTPELYAIPWFLTMFTHVLPLHKIVHIWDTLILCDKTFPLFIGLSIMKQLRNQLLGYSFNDCILIFSDLPEINIENCIKNSQYFFNSTPKSLTQRNLTPLTNLKEEICARIEICDLINNLKKENNKVLILDGRCKKEVSTLGKIKNSIQLSKKDNHIIDELKKNNSYEFIVVISDLDLANYLVSNNIQKICTLIGCSLPPDFYY